MSALKYGFLFAALVLVISTPVYASNENTLRIENITSVSDIIDSHFFSLAKAAKIDALRASLFGSWSPDGSRLLIVSAFQPPGTAGLTAVYAMNADGTEVKEIASTLNNTRSKSLNMILESWSPDGNKIVILTNIFRLRDFYVLAEPDGTLFRVVGKNLTAVDSIRENILNIEWQRDFSWSPDGTKALVVMGFDPRKYQLYVVDKNGDIRQLTNESVETNVWNPVWSHDGKKIAFNGKNLWIINEDGTGLKQLVQEVENIYAGTIAWSRDDSKIFYQAGWSIRTINVDGTGAFEVVGGGNRTMDDIFSLSPDGQRILFTASTNEKVASKLYVIDSDGRNQKLLLDNITSRNVISVGWSPKGDKIAFIEDGNLYTINPDGSGRATIALTLVNYAWHPSGDHIAFSSEIDKKTRKDVDHSRFWPKEDSYTRQVFVSKSDGTERVQITSNYQFNYQLGGRSPDLDYGFGSWSPDGSRLLVESFDNKFDKMNLLVIKFSGYDEVMSLHVPSSVQQDEEFAIQVKSMSKPVENATIFLNSKTNENGFIFLNGMEIGATNETGFSKYSFREAGNYRLSAAKQGFRTVSRSIIVKEQPSEQTANTPALAPKEVADAPNTPGFSLIFSVIVLTVIAILRSIR